MKKTFLAFASLLLLLTSLPAQQPAFITDSLDTYINREMKAWGLPGMAIAIVKDGQVVVSKGYGVRELGTKDSVNNETLFQIASCTKAFTATSLALLDHDKMLSLDDTVRRWMPSFSLYDPYATHLVTVRDLLCHHLGLQTFQGDFLNWDSNLSRSEIISAIARNKPVFGFRTEFGYSNSAFLTAGEIIPIVTKISWDEFVKDTFFIPLKMTHSFTHYADLISDKNACKPHSRWEGKEVVIPYDNVDNLGPAASISSCVNDLSHWLLMQLDSGRFDGKRIVPFSVLEQTREPQTIIPSKSPTTHFMDYCLGWFTSDFHGKQVYWHTGGASGFLSLVCFVPDLHLGFVVLTNCDNNALFSALRYQLIEAYMNEPYRNYSALFLKGFLAGQDKSDKEEAGWMAKAAKKEKLPVDIKLFAGAYVNPVYGEMKVVVMNGKIAASFEHHPKVFATFSYIGDSTFMVSFNTPLWGIKTAPVTIKNNKVTAITISVNEEVDAMKYTFTR